MQAPWRLPGSPCVVLLRLAGLCMSLTNTTGANGTSSITATSCVQSGGRMFSADSPADLVYALGWTSGMLAYEALDGGEAEWHRVPQDPAEPNGTFKWMYWPKLDSFYALNRGLSVRSQSDPAITWQRRQACAGDTLAAFAPPCDFLLPTIPAISWDSQGAMALYVILLIGAGFGGLMIVCSALFVCRASARIESLQRADTSPVTPITTASTEGLPVAIPVQHSDAYSNNTANPMRTVMADNIVRRGPDARATKPIAIGY